MYYKVERTYVSDEAGRPRTSADRLPHLVPGASARAAVLAFITHNRGCLLGAITELPGDKATATASEDGRVYVLFVQRAAEAIRTAGSGSPQRNEERP